ncbi:uncharacterized protein LOC142174441 [Nicotiana tabacum]|uniref:Uncharacterized protein LOC142174441 n=1 Tax=Nicotiana tabacum TaxID=4097 RepID=A0AC58TGI7_TOBAC
MNLLASEKEAARAQLSSAESQLQGMKEKNLEQDKKIEDLQARLVTELTAAKSKAETAKVDAEVAEHAKCQSQRETLKEIRACGFDLTIEIKNAKELEVEAEALVSSDDDDSESMIVSESGEDLEGEDIALGEVSFDKQSKKQRNEHRIRLNASIDVARFLLYFGLSFRGHDESDYSKNKGLFIGILEWLAKRLPQVDRVILKHAPKNDMMTLPKIQKAIVSACAQETVKAIINDLDRDYFGILVDESKDISHHEQISFVLRYVEKKGQVNESFIGLVRVGDTSAKFLKEAIISLLMKHSLSPSKIRGQGYDGASNMQGKMNGLKALIMQETTSTHCIHCFAHQLQLTLVAVTKKHKEVETFFVIVANVLNVIGASFKRRDKLRDNQAELLERLVESGEVQSGKELNQERGLQRPDDTRWGSHCKTLDNFLILFASIVHVLGVIEYEGSEANDRLQAEAFLSKINSFKFVFMHASLDVEGIVDVERAE